MLLDVRELNEYEISHAAFATLAPLSMLKRLIFPESRDSGTNTPQNAWDLGIDAMMYWCCLY